MAPFSTALSPSNLDARTAEPFDLPSYLSSLTLKEREALTHPPHISHPLSKRSEDASPILSPIDTFNALTARNTVPTHSGNPAVGSVDPSKIDMRAIQAIFALIGAALVLGCIWFFFWAKNGGFQWRKGDWEEYKSTVLRRKGPNGTTLSNATKSTQLGGGSVVGEGYSDVDGTMTELSSEAPIIKEKQFSWKKTQKESAKERKQREAAAAQWEGGHDNDVRAYRHEKVARVGGLNRDSDAQYYGADYTATDHSEVHNNRPSYQEHRQSPRQASPEKRQSRREFSYGQDASFNAPPQPQHSSRPPRYQSPTKNTPRQSRQSMPGSYAESECSDVQSQYTKSYHHPMPGLSGQGRGHGGYRRDRRDSLDE